MGELTNAQVADILDQALAKFYNCGSSRCRFMCYLLEDKVSQLGITLVQMYQIKHMINDRLSGFITLNGFLMSTSPDYWTANTQPPSIREQEKFELRVKWYKDWIVELRGSDIRSSVKSLLIKGED